ncbi:MAG: rod shape-determining protein MreC [Synergistaceae bacterium]|jgi:rod shape-determining protein MreC|nr:rod shape-determining protein MreC [Synergistaceae bacterium]
MSKLNPVLVNTLLALLCGLMLLWSSFAFPDLTKRMVDITGSVLYAPELPAQELRLLVRATGNWVMERKSLQDRNRELELENLTLRTALVQATAPAPPRVSGAEMIVARVTLRYPDAWWKEIRIDKGANQGVRAGAPALVDGFIIGKVVRVGDDYSWVELVTSASFLLAAVVDDTWDLGVINGDDMGNIWLLYTPPETEFTRGMVVSTALVGDYLPPGIPIGMIWSQGELRDGFMPQKVVSGAHLTQLYNVQVLGIDLASAAGAAK